MTTTHRNNCPNYHATPPASNTTHANTFTHNTNTPPPTATLPPTANNDNMTINSSDSDTSIDLLSSTNINREVELSQTSLYDSCPRHRHRDLDTLIEHDTPHAVINATILRWINESGNAHTDDYDDDQL